MLNGMPWVAGQTSVEYLGPWFRDFTRALGATVGSITRFAQERPIVAIILVALVLLLFRTTRSST